MAVAGGDYVHFVVEYGGKIKKCRVTETALLNYPVTDEMIESKLVCPSRKQSR
jgi:Ni,Fe-hydrogenase III large subunit